VGNQAVRVGLPGEVQRDTVGYGKRGLHAGDVRDLQGELLTLLHKQTKALPVG
jgi:hypothetical protein